MISLPVVLGATLLAGARLERALDGLRHAHLAPARGIIEVNEQRLAVGDGIAAMDERQLTIVAREDSELIRDRSGCRARGTAYF
ncbi:MAG TPA: hypothetical protein VGF94_24985 [Kofleriaceae bacterium]|jgi:hypothetical protein